MHQIIALAAYRSHPRLISIDPNWSPSQPQDDGGQIQHSPCIHFQLIFSRTGIPPNLPLRHQSQRTHFTGQSVGYQWLCHSYHGNDMLTLTFQIAWAMLLIDVFFLEFLLLSCHQGLPRSILRNLFMIKNTNIEEFTNHRSDMGRFNISFIGASHHTWHIPTYTNVVLLC